MAGAYISDHTGLRLRDLRQPCHLSKITDPHFQNRDLIFVTQTENGQRQSQLIIKISLGFQCPVLFFQNISDHFLGAGLTYASGDPHHGDLKLFQIKLRNILHCLKGRFHLDIGKFRSLKHPLRNRSQSALCHHIRNKSVSVHPFSYDRHKKSAGFRLPAVGDNRIHLPVQRLLQSMINSPAHLYYIS